MIRQIPCILLLGLAIVVGSIGDRATPLVVTLAGDYQVLAADFHIHSSFGSDGMLTPLGLLLEARLQGLDAIAITGHNNVVEGRVGRRLSRTVGGITVLRGEEIVAPQFHIIALGVDHTVDFRKNAEDAIDEVHRQGGIAIAAHAGPDYSRAFSDTAVGRLDGAEMCHPMVYGRERAQGDLETFAARGAMAAIGSSDFHGFGRMGSCRTFVFVHDNSEATILEAIRERHTVTFGVGGKAYGDPEFVHLAESAGLRHRVPKNERGNASDWLSRIGGLVGLAGLVLNQARRADRV
jgi:predicted metal-dependent phosphoesterase TrpH